MKKIFALLLALGLLASMIACKQTAPEETTAAPEETTTAPEETTAAPEETTAAPEDGLMSYAEYMAAAVDEPVKFACYVQDHQSWWADKITVYAADEDGAYFLYSMACSEEDAAKLVPGTKIIVTGYKAEWAGEVEVGEGATFEFAGDDTFIAEAKDVSEVAYDDLVTYINQLVTFKGMTVKSVTYKNDPGTDDAYIQVEKDGVEYSFCVEYYLRNSETEVYKAVQELQEGDLIDITAYLYWYNGPNPHVIEVAK